MPCNENPPLKLMPPYFGEVIAKERETRLDNKIDLKLDVSSQRSKWGKGNWS